MQENVNTLRDWMLDIPGLDICDVKAWMLGIQGLDVGDFRDRISRVWGFRIRYQWAGNLIAIANWTLDI